MKQALHFTAIKPVNYPLPSPNLCLVKGLIQGVTTLNAFFTIYFVYFCTNGLHVNISTLENIKEKFLKLEVFKDQYSRDPNNLKDRNILTSIMDLNNLPNGFGT